MTTWFRKSLKAKLLTLFTSIILVVVTSIGAFSYLETSKAVKSDIVKFSSQILRQANLNLERYYREYEQGILLLGESQSFKNWLQTDAEDVYHQFYYLTEFREDYIYPFQFRHPEILSITVKSDRGPEIHHDFKYGMRLGYSLDEEPWLEEAFRTDKERVYIHVGETPYYIGRDGLPITLLVMTMVKRFGDSDKGYVKMDIALDPAQQILNEIELGRDFTGMISDRDGHVIVHPDHALVNSSLDPVWKANISASNSGSFFVDETHEMVVYDTIPYTGWKTIVVTYYPALADSVERVKNVTIIVAGSGILLAIFLSIALTSSITKRISVLRKTMKRTQMGDFEKQAEIKGIDEIAELGHSYNQMLYHLDESVHQLAESKLRQQKAVLSALQSQINSHFLYNTLESINSMAILADHKDIEQTTVSLSNMLRYTSSYKEAVVTIEDEINHLISYLNICKIRYGEELTYEIHAEDDCRDVPCLKAVLQPLAENAIKHGIETSGGAIHLTVYIYRVEDLIMIKVMDNGQGFNEVALERLQRLLGDPLQLDKYDQLTQVGLLNVSYRLGTYYTSEQARMTVANTEPDGGAVIMITFPCKREEVAKS